VTGGKKSGKLGKVKEKTQKEDGSGVREGKRVDNSWETQPTCRTCSKGDHTGKAGRRRRHRQKLVQLTSASRKENAMSKRFRTGGRVLRASKSKKLKIPATTEDTGLKVVKMIEGSREGVRSGAGEFQKRVVSKKEGRCPHILPVR